MVHNANYKQAEEAVYASDFDTALSIINEQLQANPNDTDFLSLRASTYNRMGEDYASKEVQDLLHLFDLRSPDQFDLERISYAYERLEDVDGVLKYRQMALDLPEIEAWAIPQQYLGMGAICEKVGQYEDALKHYNAGLADALANNRSVVMLTQARRSLHQKLGKFEGIIEDYTLDIQEDPEDHHAYLSRGRAFAEHLQDYAAAIADFTHLIDQVVIGSNGIEGTVSVASIGGSAKSALRFRGICHFNMNDHEHAVEDLTNYLLTEEENEYNREELVRAYSTRAAAHYNLEAFNKATEDFGHAINVDPKDPTLWASRASLKRIHQRDYYGAIEDANKAVQLAPNDAEGYVQRGMAYVGLERSQEAYSDLSKALALDPSRNDMRFVRAIAGANIGKIDAALAALYELRDQYIEGFTSADVEATIMEIEALRKKQGFFGFIKGIFGSH